MAFSHRQQHSYRRPGRRPGETSPWLNPNLIGGSALVVGVVGLAMYFDNKQGASPNTGDAYLESNAFMTYTTETVSGQLPKGIAIRETPVVDRHPTSGNACATVTADSKIKPTRVKFAEPAHAPNGGYAGFILKDLQEMVATSDLSKCHSPSGRLWVAQGAAGLALR